MILRLAFAAAGIVAAFADRLLTRRPAGGGVFATRAAIRQPGGRDAAARFVRTFLVDVHSKGSPSVRVRTDRIRAHLVA